MKIVYCLNNLYQLGGIVKVVSLKASLLAEKFNHEIYIIVLDKKEKPIYEISNKVKILSLDIDHSVVNHLKGLKYYFSLLQLVIIHKKRIKEQLKLLDPDIVISVGQWEKLVIPLLKGKWKTIREFHFSKDYRGFLKYSKYKKLDYLCKKIIEKIDDTIFLKNFDKIIVLTEEDYKENWRNWKDVNVIPNPVTLLNKQISNLKEKKIISIGRLTDQKNYKSLINIFLKISELNHNWKLEIYGEGIKKEELINQIQKSKLDERVILKGETLNINEALVSSSIFVLTSLYEGMPLVLLEAMSAGLPIITYSCPCGPKDLIEDGKNGYLIPTNREDIFVDKLFQLMEDENLRREMGLYTLHKIKRFIPENIIKEWDDLFKNLISEK